MRAVNEKQEIKLLWLNSFLLLVDEQSDWSIAVQYVIVRYRVQGIYAI